MVGIIAVLGVASSAVVLSSPASAQKGPEFIPGRYIVVLQDGVSPQDVIRGHGVVPDFVYSHALNGFSAPISPKLLDELKQDPRVVHIEQDQKVYAFYQPPPTGIDRIDAEPASSPSSFAGDVTVAIIDTGIDFDHPDLNVVKRVNCAKKGPTNNKCFPDEGKDGNGHGTHVAGTVAAIHNDIGVVGVVPGADLVAVKVLGNDGSGWMSWIIAGVDYVTSTRTNGDPYDDIDVANMSLGCQCSSSALDTAISISVTEGVTYAVAAGNSAKNASTFSPANHPDVITVSAIADFNGQPGGLAPSTCRNDVDDTFADFSNFGSLIELAAPGVCILSTYKDGGYATFSGTSMASPHVAGAAAKLIAESATSLSPSQVLNGLIASGIKEGPNYFSGDPDNSAEPLVYVGNTSGNPSVSITSPADGAIVSGTVIITANSSDDDGSVNQVEFFVDGASVGVDTDSTGGWSASWDSTTDGTHSISATATDNEANTASDNISVTVDNVDDPPSVSITSPTDGSTISGTVTITAGASDDKGVTKVEFFVDGASVGVDNDGSNGWSASWDSTTAVDDFSHSISAEATDTIDQTKNDSINVTVNNASQTSAIVDSITYTPYGGKNSDKHLDIQVLVINNLGNPLSGASVSITLDNTTTGDSWTGTATTDGSGIVIFTLKNAPSGCYTTTVTDVTANGPTWNGATPPNNSC